MKDRRSLEKELADLKKSWNSIIQANVDFQDENKNLNNYIYELEKKLDKIKKIAYFEIDGNEAILLIRGVLSG